VPPVDDQVTPLTAIGGHAHHGPAIFALMLWSLALEVPNNQLQSTKYRKDFFARIGDQLCLIIGGFVALSD
jgi:hypothetical protein